MNPAFALPPDAAVTPQPVDGTRVYHLRAEGQTWSAIANCLDCTADQAKHAATRYANAHAFHVFG